jgi:hypothetical protein
MSGLQSPGIPLNLVTPWLGVIERTCIYAFMLWMVVFAIVLLNTPTPARHAASAGWHPV